MKLAMNRGGIARTACAGAMLTVACTLIPPPLLAQGWQRVERGVEYRERQAPDSLTGFRISTVRFDTALVRFHAVDVYGRLARLPGSHLYALSELIEVAQPIAAINGGFTASFSVPSPVGLLVDSGRTVVPLNRKSSVLSGILCVRTIGGSGVSIIRREKYNSNCAHAIQSGPLIVESSRLGILPSEPRRRENAARSFVCTDRAGRVVFGQTTAVSLFDLGRLLIREDPEGVGCVDAINFSGTRESAMYVRLGNVRLNGLDTPIASALLVYHR
jgi:uncharacterized protein YigE (DUF2233 family)